MTVEERRAIREALAKPGDAWQFELDGLRLVCPACLADEWMEGATVPLMEQREHLPSGEVCFHFGCPDCGLQVPADFLLYDLGAFIPEARNAWN